MRLGPLLVAWLALMLMLAATVGASLLPIGAWRQAINLVIAGAKAAVILAIFMKLRSETALVRLTFAASGALLIAFASLLAADYQLRPKLDPTLTAEVATPR
jgi:cytochrome c oxidase subunit 4